MRVSSLSIVVLLIAAICSGNAGESQAKTGAKSEIVGHWAAPDCARTAEALTFTEKFYIKSSPSHLELHRYARAGTGPDHLILMINGEKRPFMRQEDGVLRTGRYAEGALAAVAWEGLNLSIAEDYTNCPATPAVIPGPLQRLTQHLDRMDAACSSSTRGHDCARVAFKAADEDGDKKISAPELRRALVSAFLLSRLAGGQPLNDTAIDAAALAAKDFADNMATHMMMTQDKDNNGDLDYNEVVAYVSAPDAPLLKNMLTDIGLLFPAVKLALLKL